MTLRLDWAGYDAATYACRHWHYSRTAPAGRLIVIGVWEAEAFKGVVIFSRGATPRIGSPYGLTQLEVCDPREVPHDWRAAGLRRAVGKLARSRDRGDHPLPDDHRRRSKRMDDPVS